MPPPPRCICWRHNFDQCYRNRVHALDHTQHLHNCDTYFGLTLETGGWQIDDDGRCHGAPFPLWIRVDQLAFLIESSGIL